MLKVIYVGFGGFIGSILRYSLYILSSNILGYTSPVATIFVNIIGCFLIGFAYQLFNTHLIISENLRLFIMIGLLGGFTTFSAFSIDAFLVYQNSGKILAIAYVVLSIILSLLATLTGVWLIKS
jgi:CrcB protein